MEPATLTGTREGIIRVPVKPKMLRWARERAGRSTAVIYLKDPSPQGDEAGSRRFASLFVEPQTWIELRPVEEAVDPSGQSGG